MVSLTRLLDTIKDNGGFITETDLHYLKIHCPNRILLVRCNLGRFLCKVHELEARIEKITDPDYLRDVSLPTSDPVWS